jgi:hypothetical protein
VGQGAIARNCHGPHQVFIEVRPQAKGTGADAQLGQARHFGGDLVLVREALIGLAVGEQQHPVHLGGIELFCHLGGSRQPAIEESRAATAVDRVDRSDKGLGISDGGGGNDHLHLSIKGDDGETITAGEFPGQEAGRLAGIAELDAAHRAGAIDHQGQVERRPLLVSGIGLQCWGCDCE